MTEKEILDLIKNDSWMMNIIHVAEGQNLPGWMIAAGFVRNKVWDYLHGIDREGVETHDIDLIYFDKNGNDEKADDALSERLKKEVGIDFEVTNQAYAHIWKNLPPYSSTEEAMSYWPETATIVGARIQNNELKLIAPDGIEDLINLIVRMNPRFPEGLDKVKKRVESKGWLQKWPKLKADF